MLQGFLSRTKILSFCNSLSLMYSVSFSLHLSFLILTLSSSLEFVVLVHLDNFLSHGLFFSHFFIMKGDYWRFFYYTGLSFYIKFNGVRQVTFINTEVTIESLGSFKKLPRITSCFLEFCL